MSKEFVGAPTILSRTVRVFLPIDTLPHTHEYKYAVHMHPLLLVKQSLIRRGNQSVMKSLLLDKKSVFAEEGSVCIILIA